ncbi:hypothetical protein [Streptomyces sp. NBC_01483]|nr:hypothetical protein [Streptomyces sp. NBC_01483]
MRGTGYTDPQSWRSSRVLLTSFINKVIQADIDIPAVDTAAAQ